MGYLSGSPALGAYQVKVSADLRRKTVVRTATVKIKYVVAKLKCPVYNKKIYF